MKIKAIKASYAGDSEEASEQDIRERANRAFVCSFFGVKPNTPDEILMQAIERYTGRKLNYKRFRHYIKSDKSDTFRQKKGFTDLTLFAKKGSFPTP